MPSATSRVLPAIPAIILLILLSLMAPASARAQLAFNATVESSYRFRGIALTNGKPDLKLGVAYDHRSGLYGGGAVILGEGDPGSFQAVGYVAYAGYATRTTRGLGLDFGATNARIIDHYPFQVTRRSPQNTTYTQTVNVRYAATYTEVYAGVLKGALSAHVYLSPSYLGEGLRTAYLDVNATVRPADHIRLFVHGGALTPLGGGRGPNRKRERFDLKTGAAIEFDHGELQLAWTTVRPIAEYPIGFPVKRDAVVLSASVFF